MKFIFLSMILVLSSYADYSYTRVYKNNEKAEVIEEVSKSRPFRFSGKIFNITEYSSHTRVVIMNKNERVKLVINEQLNKKENDYIRGFCTEFSYDEYSDCSVY